LKEDEENLYHIRSRKLQKQIFAQQKWESHKMVGVWSPVHRTGVTTFTLNFAFFLANHRIYTAVLEGLTEQTALRDWLLRYTEVPKNWTSFARAIHEDGIVDQTDWTYKNVKFLPLDHTDSEFEWNSISLGSYMTTTRVVDVTLVDFPTGTMAPYTLDSLQFLDELWIVVDDSFEETLKWNNYIKELRKKVKIPVYLIFNKAYEFSQSDRIAKNLSVQLLATLPSLHKEVMRNYYEKEPIYFNEEVAVQLTPLFLNLARHLFGKDIALEEKRIVNHKKWWQNLLKPLKS
jgi:MinD-like ATPase involved in chromosome partitioning or flagellar assembly